MVELLTHEAATDEPDHDTMTLKTTDGGSVTVFFDGEPENTATMSSAHYDRLVTSEAWEEAGFRQYN